MMCGGRVYRTSDLRRCAMTKCLVIGASSFIGVYTVEAFLGAGYEVVATGRNQKFASHYESLGVPYIGYELSDENAVEALPSDIDVVAHIAGRLPANSLSGLQAEDDDAADYIKENTLSVAYLLRWAVASGVERIISTVSYADVQNKWDCGEPIEESWNRDFRLYGDHAAYVISKNAACDLLLYYNNQHDMKNVIFRLPPVYGVGPHLSLNVNGERKRSGIGRFIDLAKAGETITVYGSGEDYRDIVYVKDVATAFVLAAQSTSAKGLYNIGSGETVSLRDQAEAIAKTFAGSNGRSDVVLDESRTNGIVSYGMNISKANQQFGYRPVYSSFEDMMHDWKEEEIRGVYGSLFDQ